MPDCISAKRSGIKVMLQIASIGVGVELEMSDRRQYQLMEGQSIT